MSEANIAGAGWGDEEPVVELIPPPRVESPVDKSTPKLEEDEEGEEAAVIVKLPDDFAGALKAVKAAEVMPMTTTAQQDQRRAVLHAARKNLHRVQQGVPSVVITADHHAENGKARRDVLANEKLEYFARTNPLAKSMLDELKALRAGNPGDEGRPTIEDGNRMVAEITRLRGLAAARAEGWDEATVQMEAFKTACNLKLDEIDTLKTEVRQLTADLESTQAEVKRLTAENEKLKKNQKR